MIANRRTVTGVLGGALLSALSGLALAQDSYPSRPITLIVPFPPAAAPTW